MGDQPANLEIKNPIGSIIDESVNENVYLYPWTFKSEELGKTMASSEVTVV